MEGWEMSSHFTHCCLEYKEESVQKEAGESNTGQVVSVIKPQRVLQELQEIIHAYKQFANTVGLCSSHSPSQPSFKMETEVKRGIHSQEPLNDRAGIPI